MICPKCFEKRRDCECQPVAEPVVHVVATKIEVHKFIEQRLQPVTTDKQLIDFIESRGDVHMIQDYASGLWGVGGMRGNVNDRSFYWIVPYGHPTARSAIGAAIQAGLKLPDMKEMVSPFCVWSSDDIDSGYDTSCGNKFEFNHGGPRANGFQRCPYCGFELKEGEAV